MDRRRRPDWDYDYKYRTRHFPYRRPPSRSPPRSHDRKHRPWSRWEFDRPPFYEEYEYSRHPDGLFDPVYPGERSDPRYHGDRSDSRYRLPNRESHFRISSQNYISHHSFRYRYDERSFRFQSSNTNPKPTVCVPPMSTERRRNSQSSQDKTTEDPPQSVPNVKDKKRKTKSQKVYFIASKNDEMLIPTTFQNTTISERITTKVSVNRWSSDKPSLVSSKLRSRTDDCLFDNGLISSSEMPTQKGGTEISATPKEEVVETVKKEIAPKYTSTYNLPCSEKYTYESANEDYGKEGSGFPTRTSLSPPVLERQTSLLTSYYATETVDNLHEDTELKQRNNKNNSQDSFWKLTAPFLASLNNTWNNQIPGLANSQFLFPSREWDNIPGLGDSFESESQVSPVVTPASFSSTTTTADEDLVYNENDMPQDEIESVSSERFSSDLQTAQMNVKTDSCESKASTDEPSVYVGIRSDTQQEDIVRHLLENKESCWSSLVIPAFHQELEFVQSSNDHYAEAQKCEALDLSTKPVLNQDLWSSEHGKALDLSSRRTKVKVETEEFSPVTNDVIVDGYFIRDLPNMKMPEVTYAVENQSLTWIKQEPGNLQDEDSNMDIKIANVTSLSDDNEFYLMPDSPLIPDSPRTTLSSYHSDSSRDITFSDCELGGQEDKSVLPDIPSQSDDEKTVITDYTYKRQNGFSTQHNLELKPTPTDKLEAQTDTLPNIVPKPKVVENKNKIEPTIKAFSKERKEPRHCRYEKLNNRRRSLRSSDEFANIQNRVKDKPSSSPSNNLNNNSTFGKERLYRSSVGNTKTKKSTKKSKPQKQEEVSENGITDIPKNRQSKIQNSKEDSCFKMRKRMRPAEAVFREMELMNYRDQTRKRTTDEAHGSFGDDSGNQRKFEKLDDRMALDRHGQLNERDLDTSKAKRTTNTLPRRKQSTTTTHKDLPVVKLKKMPSIGKNSDWKIALGLEETKLKVKEKKCKNEVPTQVRPRGRPRKHPPPENSNVETKHQQKRRHSPKDNSNSKSATRQNDSRTQPPIVLQEKSSTIKAYKIPKLKPSPGTDLNTQKPKSSIFDFASDVDEDLIPLRHLAEAANKYKGKKWKNILSFLDSSACPQPQELDRNNGFNKSNMRSLNVTQDPISNKKEPDANQISSSRKSEANITFQSDRNAAKAEASIVKLTNTTSDLKVRTECSTVSSEMGKRKRWYTDSPMSPDDY